MENQKLTSTRQLQVEDITFTVRPVAALEWWVSIDGSDFRVKKLIETLNDCMTQLSSSFPSTLLPMSCINNPQIMEVLKHYKVVVEDPTSPQHTVRADAGEIVHFHSLLVRAYEEAMRLEDEWE